MKSLQNLYNKQIERLVKGFGCLWLSHVLITRDITATGVQWVDVLQGIAGILSILGSLTFFTIGVISLINYALNWKKEKDVKKFKKLSKLNNKKRNL
jgi:hypothetical protein